jgi:hypothetical protein
MASDAYPQDYFGGSVDVVQDWAVIGAPFSNKGVKEVQAITTKGQCDKFPCKHTQPCSSPSPSCFRTSSLSQSRYLLSLETTTDARSYGLCALSDGFAALPVLCLLQALPRRT